MMHGQRNIKKNTCVPSVVIKDLPNKE